MKTLITASVVALGLFTASAQAAPQDVFTQINETAPRSGVFTDLNNTAPRSVFTDINETAPRTYFDDLNESAPPLVRRHPGHGSAFELMRMS